jgi:GAF domain-containing protein
MSIFKAFIPSNLPAKVTQKDPLSIQREIILQHFLNAFSGFGLLALILSLVHSSFVISNFPLWILVLILWGVLLAVTIGRGLPYPIRAGTLIVTIAIIGLSSMLSEGLNVTSLLFALVFIAAVAVLFGPNMGYISIAVVALLLASLGWLIITGRITLPSILKTVNPTATTAWINSIVAVLLVSTCIVGAFALLFSALSSALERQKSLAEEAKEEKELLDKRVEERTVELSRKTAQLEAAGLVASAISGAPDVEQILDTAIEMIKEKFGFYQVNIFLNDGTNEFTVLRAATGDAGKKLLQSDFRLQIGETGIVGEVAYKGKPRIARDVAADPNYIAVSDLPATHAEMAVPMFAGDKVSGVLDIQSDQVHDFSADDVETIVTLAGQISHALENARMVEDLQRSLADLENSNRQFTQATWSSHLKSSKRIYAYRYRQSRIENISSHTPESLKAFQQGSTIITSSPASSQSTQPFATLAIPIKVRDQTLGVINMRVAGGSVSPDLVELVEGAVNRLSASLENARLLEEIQTRAERERLVGDIASKVRTATDIDSILRTTAGELGRSLGVSEVVIQLNNLK